VRKGLEKETGIVVVVVVVVVVVLHSNSLKVGMV